MFQFSCLPPLSVYVHLPWCVRKCPYCDFNSHVVRGVDQTRYASALVRELEHMADMCERQHVTSVFFGGGTPSLMEPETVGAVISGIRRLWPWSDQVEITLAANPTSVEAGKFAAFREPLGRKVDLPPYPSEHQTGRAAGRGRR